jgi:membrane protein
MDRILFFSIGISILIPLVQLFYLFYRRFFNKDSKFIQYLLAILSVFAYISLSFVVIMYIKPTVFDSTDFHNTIVIPIAAYLVMNVIIILQKYIAKSNTIDILLIINLITLITICYYLLLTTTYEEGDGDVFYNSHKQIMIFSYTDFIGVLLLNTLTFFVIKK